MNCIKPTLLLVTKPFFSVPHHKHIFEKYFNMVMYEPGSKHDPKNTIVCLDCQQRPDHYVEFYDQGFPVIIDNLWEKKEEYTHAFPILKETHYAQRTHLLHNVNWFWYNESLWYTDLGLDQYQPKRTYQNLALMPMNLARPNRNMLYNCMGPYLSQFVWSYVAKGKRLPRDRDNNGNIDQRHLDPDWYNSTCFSIASETYTESSPGQPVFITEKTFKPIAFRHPFMVFGNAGTLEHLHSIGFETYENLFDESYDVYPDPYTRVQTIVNNVQSFKRQPYDQLTLDKIEYNHHRFFNLHLVKQRIIKEIIEPILEYAKI
jgi:hypothetical protein